NGESAIDELHEMIDADRAHRVRWNQSNVAEVSGGEVASDGDLRARHRRNPHHRCPPQNSPSRFPPRFLPFQNNPWKIESSHCGRRLATELPTLQAAGGVADAALGQRPNAPDASAKPRRREFSAGSAIATSGWSGGYQ